MSVVDEFRKLTRSDILLSVGLFVSVIAPGFLTIFLYKPELVASLETFKLVVFSGALGLPVVVVNHLVVSQTQRFKNNSAAVGFAMFLTYIVFYSALLVSYFWNFSFRWYLGILMAIQMLFVGIIVIGDKNAANKP
jgi:hypothetical protein